MHLSWNFIPRGFAKPWIEILGHAKFPIERIAFSKAEFGFLFRSCLTENVIAVSKNKMGKVCFST